MIIKINKKELWNYAREKKEVQEMLFNCKVLTLPAVYWGLKELPVNLIESKKELPENRLSWNKFFFQTKNQDSVENGEGDFLKVTLEGC